MSNKEKEEACEIQEASERAKTLQKVRASYDALHFEYTNRLFNDNRDLS